MTRKLLFVFNFQAYITLSGISYLVVALEVFGCHRSECTCTTDDSLTGWKGFARVGAGQKSRYRAAGLVMTHLLAYSMRTGPGLTTVVNSSLNGGVSTRVRPLTISFQIVT